MKIKFRSLFFSVLVISICLLMTNIVYAANTNFTADANITVTGVTLGNSTVNMIIFDESTAESWKFASGIFTVTNPNSFKIGSSNTAVLSIRITRGAGELSCTNNTIPGTSYFTLPTTSYTYTIVPSTSACGTPGGGTPTPSSSGGGGGGDANVDIGGTSNIGIVNSGGKNIFMYINSTANFTTSVTGGGSTSHSAKITNLDMTNKRITIVLQSNPVTIELDIGELKEVDLDGDGVADVKVKFNDLIVNKIDLTITNIAGVANLSDIGLEVGDLIKTAISNTVYYVGSAGSRHMFVNRVTFGTWFDNFDGLKIISQEDLGSLSVGANVTVKPGNDNLVNFKTTTDIYAVTPDKIIRKLTAGTGEALYGANYLDIIIAIQPGFEADYTLGDDLTVDSTKPNSTLGIEELF